MSAELVVLGLGSNLDHPLTQLRRALQALKKCTFLRLRDVSSIYESDAQVPENAPASWSRKFLNAAVLVEVLDRKSPQDVLSEIKTIEKKQGRVTSETWAPRPIDIDILYWHGQVIDEPSLKVPHPQLTARPFALLPLLQVFPLADLNKPLWAEEWILEKPFSTVKSSTFFWPRFMGIINLTEDSFSDGGQFLKEESIAEQIERLIKDGAEILDFGAESTRPMAAGVDAETEWKNLKLGLDVFRQLGLKAEVSIDTTKPTVLRRALDIDRIDFINDVTGLHHPEMIELVRASGAKTFVMHSLSVPPKHGEVISDLEKPTVDLSRWWHQRVKELVISGCHSDQFIFDPGIGFGKTKAQSQYILQHLSEFASIRHDIMIGHSRKSYQTTYSDRQSSERDLETALSTSRLNLAFSQYLRVHDVTTQKIALRFKS